MSSQQRLSCGRDIVCVPDVNLTLDEALKSGFDFVCLPIVNPRLKREHLAGPAKSRSGPLTRSDLLVSNSDWSSLVVAKVSPWLQPDSPHAEIRKNSEKALKEELMYASHLSTPAVLVTLTDGNCVNLARIVNEYILQGFGHTFWVQLPMVSAESDCDDIVDACGEAAEMNYDRQVEPNCDMKEAEVKTEQSVDTWTWWNRFRTLCDNNKKLGLVLEVSADLPSDDIIERWCGEPIRAAVISTALFLTNKKGFPVLSRSHQNLIRKLFKLDIQLILSGKERHLDKGIRAYQMYLEHLHKSQDPPDNISQFAKGYEDYLQCPLQPLMDNLESHTYEVFERDPVKYSQYQQAVYCALRDRVPAAERATHVTTVMVLGAGRGPLVTASINAAQAANCKIHVYAVEKNPNAVVTLENLKADSWGDQVTIVSCDMRLWEAPVLADIIVSELLGSFGDNELSPECLDGAQRFLKPDGISIPCSYTSYVAPLSSMKLWNEARSCRDVGKPPGSHFETPYVVRLHNSRLLDEAQPLFSFTHPNKDVDNSRYGSLTFDISLDTIFHGFGGYFYCILYGDVTISIVPQLHTPGMFSWFPMYFPIKEPQYLRRGDKLVAHFWRVNNARDVWYEWSITEPVALPVHNPKGRAYTIGL